MKDEKKEIEKIGFRELSTIVPDLCSEEPSKQAVAIEMLILQCFHLQRQNEHLVRFVERLMSENLPRDRPATMQEFLNFRDSITDPLDEPYRLADCQTPQAVFGSPKKDYSS